MELEACARARPEEKNADLHAEHATVKSKVSRDSNRGNTGAIEIVGGVKNKEKRTQPKRNTATGSLGRHGCNRRNRA